jgi:hypothetical protein
MALKSYIASAFILTTMLNYLLVNTGTTRKQNSIFNYTQVGTVGTVGMGYHGSRWVTTVRVNFES